MAQIEAQWLDVPKKLSEQKIYDKILRMVSPKGRILAVGDSARPHAIYSREQR